MHNCPHCGRELTRDPKNEGKLLCYDCKKRFDEAKLAAREAGMTTNQPPAQAPMQPPAYAPMPQAQGQPYQQPQVPDAQYGQMPTGMPPQVPYPQQGAPYQPYPQQSKSKGIPILALVIAIATGLGILSPILNIGCIILDIVAIVIAASSIRKARRGQCGGKGISIAAIIISVIVALLCTAVTTLAIIGMTQPDSNVQWGVTVHKGSDATSSEKGNSVAPSQGKDTSSEVELYEPDEEHEWRDGATSPSGFATVSIADSVGGKWMTREIQFDGFTIVLGKTTPREICDKLGWTPDRRFSEIYWPENDMLEAGENFDCSLLSSKYNMDYFGIGLEVENTSDSDMNFMDCPLIGFDAMTYEQYDANPTYPSISMAGLVWNSTTLKDAYVLFGSPVCVRESETVGNTLMYYDKELVNFLSIGNEGKVDDPVSYVHAELTL